MKLATDLSTHARDTVKNPQQIHRREEKSTLLEIKCSK